MGALRADGLFARALECVSHLKHIHESAEEVDYEVLCQDYVSEAGMYAHLREWAEAKAAYAIALDLARTKIHDGPNQQKWLLRATTELAQACVQLGELKEGLDLYAESLLVAMSMRDDEKAMKVHMYMSTVYKMRRDLRARSRISTTRLRWRSRRRTSSWRGARV